MSYSLVNKLMDPKGEPRKRMKAAGLSIYARSVLLELAQFANERNYRAVNYCECWPSHATLASGVHCSVSGVKNALKASSTRPTYISSRLPPWAQNATIQSRYLMTLKMNRRANRARARLRTQMPMPSLTCLLACLDVACPRLSGRNG